MYIYVCIIYKIVDYGCWFLNIKFWVLYSIYINICLGNFVMFFIKILNKKVNFI